MQSPCIPPADLGHVYEPLYASQGRRMGLGLTLVRMLVEGHGGTVHAESGPNAETTLSMRLPVHAA